VFAPVARQTIGEQLSGVFFRQVRSAVIFVVTGAPALDDQTLAALSNTWATLVMSLSPATFRKKLTPT